MGHMGSDDEIPKAMFNLLKGDYSRMQLSNLDSFHIQDSLREFDDQIFKALGS